jgi:hypothetical protein
MIEASEIPIYVPRGDSEFAEAVARAFPAHRLVVDPKLAKDHVRIGGGPVLNPQQHQIRRPTGKL